MCATRSIPAAARMCDLGSRGLGSGRKVQRMSLWANNNDCSPSGLASSRGIRLGEYFLPLSRGLYILNPFCRILQRGLRNFYRSMRHEPAFSVSWIVLFEKEIAYIKSLLHILSVDRRSAPINTLYTRAKKITFDSPNALANNTKTQLSSHY